MGSAQFKKKSQNIPLLSMMSELEFVTGTKTSTYLYIEAIWSDNSNDYAGVAFILVLVMFLDQYERLILLLGVCCIFFLFFFLL